MENVYWKLPLTNRILIWNASALWWRKKHPWELDLAKFQIHKDREDIKWNATEHKNAKVTSTPMTDFCFLKQTTDEHFLIAE